MNRNSATNLLSKDMTIKNMVEKIIKREWPNAKVKGETDPNEQEIRRVYLERYENEKQKMEEILAKENQRQLQFAHQCSEENLKQCHDKAQRAKQTVTDQQIDPLPDVEIKEKHKSKASVILRFKQMRLNYALSYIILVAAAVNNLHIFLTSSSFNGIDDSLMIMTLTFIVMWGIFQAGKFAHPFIYGQRTERVMVSLLGVAIGLTLFLFYLSLANLLLDGSASSVDEAILKTVYTFPTLDLINDWFMTGIALGLSVFILGLWNDNNLELLGMRTRNKVIRKRISKFNKLQIRHIKSPDFWFNQRNQHLEQIYRSIRNKERALESMNTTIDELKSSYTKKITEYRALLANWTGTDLNDVAIASLFAVEPSFKLIEDAITSDKENLLLLQAATNELRIESNVTKQAIFDCFEEEIKTLKEQAFGCNTYNQAHDNVENQSVNRIANLKDARKIA